MKIMYEGNLEEAEDVTPEDSLSKSVSWVLKDGTTLTLTRTLLTVYRLNNKFTTEGEPIYSFKYQDIIGTSGIKDEYYNITSK